MWGTTLSVFFGNFAFFWEHIVFLEPIVPNCSKMRKVFFSRFVLVPLKSVERGIFSERRVTWVHDDQVESGDQSPIVSPRWTRW